MKTDSSEDCCYTYEEAHARLDNLIKGRGHDYLKIIAIAHVLAARFRCEQRDLFQEACCRVLDGRRAWPTSVDVVPFMIQVMKSVGFDWLRRSKPMMASSLDEAESIASLLPTAEKIVEDRARLASFLGHLEDDPEAHALARARAFEASREERLALFGGDVARHDAVSRRLRRKLSLLKQQGL